MGEITPLWKEKHGFQQNNCSWTEWQDDENKVTISDISTVSIKF